LSYLFSEKLPWCNKYLDNSAVIQKLLIQKREFPVPVEIITKEKYSCANSIIDIIKGCTIIDPKKRFNMKKVNEILSHIK
jgi:hypothetical protein